MTLGQEFGGYARQVELGRSRASRRLPRPARSCRSGGTAVGTGLNARPSFAGARWRGSRARPASPSARPRTTSRRRARATRRCRAERGALRGAAGRSSRSRTTCGCWARGRAAALGEMRAARPAARLVHHAGQGESGDRGGGDPGGGAGDRERRGGRDRRPVGPARAQHVMLPLIARNLLESIELLAAAGALRRASASPGIERRPPSAARRSSSRA